MNEIVTFDFSTKSFGEITNFSKFDSNLIPLWASNSLPVDKIINDESYYLNGGVYIVFDTSKSDPVYVGFTKKPVVIRLKAHISNRNSLVGKVIAENPESLSVYVLRGDKGTESFLIRELRPGFNRAGISPGQRTGLARDIYLEREEKNKVWAEKCRKERCYIQWKQTSIDKFSNIIKEAFDEKYAELEENNTEDFTKKSIEQETIPLIISRLKWQLTLLT